MVAKTGISSILASFLTITLSMVSASCSENQDFKSSGKVAKVINDRESQNAETIEGPIKDSSSETAGAEVDEKPEHATDDKLAYGRCSAPCAGKEIVTYNSTYNKYIKAVLCSPESYDLFMGDSESGPFYKIGDTAGHGQDHCELINNFFTLGNEDDITSGSCPSCSVESAGSAMDFPEKFGRKLYYRANFGDPFVLEVADQPGIHTSCKYSCGVSY